MNRKRLPATRTLLSSLALIGMTSCLDGSAPGPDCPDEVGVTVGTGVVPVISWTPACLVQQILVEPLNGSGFAWIVSASDWITSPVTYGAIPRGAMGPEPSPLVAGARYRVSLLALGDVPGLGTRARIVGTAEFTP